MLVVCTLGDAVVVVGVELFAPPTLDGPVTVFVPEPPTAGDAVLVLPWVVCGLEVVGVAPWLWLALGDAVVVVP